jgi:hypothetical protein
MEGALVERFLRTGAQVLNVTRIRARDVGERNAGKLAR